MIEAPLAALLDPGSVRDDVRMVDGKVTRLAAYAYDGHVIWGATAMILEGFVRILRGIGCEGGSWKISK